MAINIRRPKLVNFSDKHAELFPLAQPAKKYPKELDDLIARLFKRLHTHSHHSLPLVNYAFAYISLKV